MLMILENHCNLTQSAIAYIHGKNQKAYNEKYTSRKYEKICNQESPRTGSTAAE